MNDDLFEYLIATDQVDEFFGLKEENEDNEFDIDDNENDNDEETSYENKLR